VLCVVVGVVAGAISRFTMRLLARPLALLQAGITSVREGRFEPIQAGRTQCQTSLRRISLDVII